MPTANPALGRVLEKPPELWITHIVSYVQPDVILMDGEMPIVDGLAATRIIKQQCPACRVVVLSIHNDEAIRTQARSAGADDFVDKGAPLAVLLQAIQTISIDKISS